MLIVAQVAADPTSTIPQIAQWLQAAGPFGLAAVLLIILRTLWTRLRERDARLDEMSNQFLSAVREQSAQQATTAAVLRQLCDSVGKKD